MSPLTWTRHHITSSIKRDFQSALYWWRQKSWGTMAKGAEGCGKVVGGGVIPTHCHWKELENNNAKEQQQKARGSDRMAWKTSSTASQEKEQRGKGRMKGGAEGAGRSWWRGANWTEQRQWWRCPALVMSLTFQGYFSQCSGTHYLLPP